MKETKSAHAFLTLPSTMDAQAVHDAWHGADAPLCSEAECLALIDTYFPSKTLHVPAGRGDDCADLVLPGHRLALSTDFFWEHSHFRTTYFSPHEVGAKALTVAISDLAGAGATPLGFSLGLMLPPWINKTVVAQIMEGMAFVANTYGIVLTGGDLSRSDSLGFSCTVWGSSSAQQAPFFFSRQQAQPGDVLFLAGGTAGLARTGLLALEKYGRDIVRKFPAATAAHLFPTPKFTESRALITSFPEALQKISLMDLSDGLAQDLPRLLGKYGANLTLSTIHPEIIAFAEQEQLSPKELFVLGGEDFCLLGACPVEQWKHVQATVPSLYPIGFVVPNAGIFIQDAPFHALGFDHFHTIK